jgi:hypothetical protein
VVPELGGVHSDKQPAARTPRINGRQYLYGSSHTSSVLLDDENNNNIVDVNNHAHSYAPNDSHQQSTIKLLRCYELTVGGATVSAARCPRCSRCSLSSVLLALLVYAAAVDQAARASVLLQFGGVAVINHSGDAAAAAAHRRCCSTTTLMLLNYIGSDTNL